MVTAHFSNLEYIYNMIYIYIMYMHIYIYLFSFACINVYMYMLLYIYLCIQPYNHPSEYMVESLPNFKFL